MPPFRFAAVGDNCIDRFQPPLAQSLVGGNATNVAVQLALAGHHSYYFGTVGDDRDGEHVRQLLGRNGVRLQGLRVSDTNTAYTDVGATPEGDRLFLYEDFGACAGYRPDPEDLALLMTMDHVHIGWLDDGGALRQALTSAGVSVSQDVSVNAALADLGVHGLDIAFGSAGEDDAKAEQLARDFLARGAQLAVVTRGARGAIAVDESGMVSTDSRQVDVVDTTGAGDSFIAAFLIAHLEGRPLAERLAAGCDQAARTCSHVGGFPQQPRAL